MEIVQSGEVEISPSLNVGSELFGANISVRNVHLFAVNSVEKLFKFYLSRYDTQMMNHTRFVCNIW